MLKALKRIIAWTGPYRRNLYLGCVCSFFMTWATAAPVMLAAWMLAQVVDDARGVSTLDPSAVWLSLAAIVACIAARFAFSYGKNRLQESIGYEVAPEVRIRIGTILKRVPLGYFSRMKTGDILATTTTELGMLELNGMKMIDAVVNGYVSVAAVIAFLAVMDWRCALAALAGVGLSALALAGINRRSRKLTPATHEASERLSGAIVEFARELFQQGASLADAAMEAARLRLRPILMTSLAFLIGVLPLAISTGAGSGSQNAIGTGVMGGTFAATALGIFYIPVFFVVVTSVFSFRWKWKKPKRRRTANIVETIPGDSHK